MMLQSYGLAPIYVEEEGSFEENAKKTIEAVISEKAGPADSQRVRSLVSQLARIVTGIPLV